MIIQMLRRWGWRECKYSFTSLWRKKYEMISSCIMMTSYRIACIEQSHFEGKNPQWNWFLKKNYICFFFLNIYILLNFSLLTTFQVHSKVIQLYIYTYIIFQIIFHYRLLQDIDSSSLCYTVNLSCLWHIYF